MASSLLALLAQQAPNLQTRKALILTGLQNDFLSPNGKLPVSMESGALERLKVLVPAFREYGDVIWVRSEFEANRDINGVDEGGDTVIAGPTVEAEDTDSNHGDDNDEFRESPVPFKKMRISERDLDQLASPDHRGGETDGNNPNKSQTSDYQNVDEELFLTRTAKKEACCMPGSTGAEYAVQIKDLIDSSKDMQLVKTYYSAFISTSLLLSLRSKLVTELYICGCSTNLSVYATAVDAARHGIKITLIEDCLGYRRKARHDLAIKQLRDIMDADIMTSADLIETLRNPPPPSPEDEFDEEKEEPAVEDASDDAQIDVDGDGSSVEDPELVRRLLDCSLSLRANPNLPSRAASEPKQPTTERRKPSSSRSADGSSSSSDGRRSSSEPGRNGKRKSHFGSGHSGASSDYGIVVEESYQRVRRKQPWLELLDGNGSEQKQIRPAFTTRSGHLGLRAMSTLAGLDQKSVDKLEDMMTKATRRRGELGGADIETTPLFGQGNEDESAGSSILYDLLPADLAETVFDDLNKEISWQRMHHQTGEVPRLVCCQGTIDEDGSMPVYRHPSDQTIPIESWTPVVNKIRKAAEAAVGHSLNHTLIQLYRNGNDFISEHSDKTLDVVKDSFIVNVSFGAQRTMRFRTKRTAIAVGGAVPPARTTHRIRMPHNSMIKMSLPANAQYLHGINADKRPRAELCEAEKAFSEQRISLTFRHIGTFLDRDSDRIWGHGGTARTKESARPVINGIAIESEKLVTAFGIENQRSSVCWDEVYGDGFDVLHLK